MSQAPVLPLNGEDPYSKSFLRALQGSLALARLDAHGKILEANAKFAALHAYEGSALVGAHHSVLLPYSERRSAANLALWESLRAGATVDSEFRRVTRLAADIWVRASYLPLKNDAGTVFEVVLFAHDITAEKNKAAADAETLRALDASHARLECRLDGTILSANANFLALTGTGQASWRGATTRC